MSKVKVAIIGCGGIANQKHFPALKNNSDLSRLKEVTEKDLKRTEKYKKALDILLGEE